MCIIWNKSLDPHPSSPKSVTPPPLPLSKWYCLPTKQKPSECDSKTCPDPFTLCPAMLPPLAVQATSSCAQTTSTDCHQTVFQINSDHSTSLLKMLQWLFISTEVELKTPEQDFKDRHHLVPDYFFHLIFYYSPLKILPQKPSVFFLRFFLI